MGIARFISRRMRRLPHSVLLASMLAWIGAWAAPAQAVDLWQAWQAARAHDPELAAAGHARAAGQARIRQADSLWRPTLEAQASIGRGSQETRTAGAQFAAPGFGQTAGVEFETSLRDGTQSAYGLHLRQPLIDPGRSARKAQLQHSAAQAEAVWSGAAQQALLRTAQRYADVLLAEQELAVLGRQADTVRLALARAQARFKAGDASAVDVQEARARSESLESARQLAGVQLEIARTAFQTLTGLPGQPLAVLARATPAIWAPTQQPLQAWLALAERASPEILQSQEAALIAASEADRHRAVAGVTLELVAGVGREHTSGEGAFGQAANSQTQWSAGLQLRIPLYTGGMRGARYEEALALRDEARARERLAGTRIAQAVRAAWLTLDTGEARVRALQQSLSAARIRAEATRVGLDAGDRSTLDWLDAQDELARAELTLHETLLGLLIERLRLHALAGTLDESALKQASCALVGAACEP